MKLEEITPESISKITDAELKTLHEQCHTATNAMKTEKLDITMYKNMYDLYFSCQECQKCELYKTRTNCIFNNGAIGSTIFVVGDKPTIEENVIGEPFQGLSGEVLNKMMDIAGFNSTDDLYLTNIIKCAPTAEVDVLKISQTCQPMWLDKEMELGKPKIIIALGENAIRAVTGVEDGTIRTLHGKTYERADNIKVFATYHPLDIIKDIKLQRYAFEDMIKLRAFLIKEFKNTILC